jgi:hypothetical protein
MFQTHRIFCATPWELEAERYRFYDVVGRFNEAAAIQKGILFVPVALTNVMDKRPLQYTIDQNICDCRHYILLLEENWGPEARNFRHDYQLALRCVDDPALPMRSVAVLEKRDPAGRQPAESLPEPRATFSTLTEFDDCVTALLSEWLVTLTGEAGTASNPG